MGVSLSQPSWLLSLLVCSQILKRAPDPALETIRRAAVDAIIDRHYNPDTGLDDEVAIQTLGRIRASGRRTL